jgi:hypothetical protein
MCRMKGLGGVARIGNRRNSCKVCNQFAQAVRRRTWARLVDLHKEEFDQLRLVVELELYPNVIDQFLLRYPQARPDAGETDGTG